MADELWTELCVSLAKGPSILFLGQSYLRIRGGEDSFLARAVQHFGGGDVTSYSALLDRVDTARKREIMAYLHSLSQRLGPPLWLKQLVDCPWNGVVTSAIDSNVSEAFLHPWRQVRPILNDRMKPEFPRSRTPLHIYRLFGSVDRDVEDEMPPQ